MAAEIYRLQVEGFAEYLDDIEAIPFLRHIGSYGISMRFVDESPSPICEFTCIGKPDPLHQFVDEEFDGDEEIKSQIEEYNP